MSSIRKAQRGFVLVTIYLMVPLLVIMTASTVAFVLQDVRSAQRVQAATEAFFLAEAGIDRAIAELKEDAAWTSGFSEELLGSTGTYTVTVEDLGSSRLRLTTAGSSELLSMPVVRTIEAVVEVSPAGLFNFALFGDDSVTLTGNAKTDSYDSSAGSYNAATAGSEGDVGTNGIAAGSITLTGNAQVKGDAMIGTEGDPAAGITLTGNAVVTGSKGTEDEEKDFPAVTIPGGVSNSGSLSVSGNTTRTYPGGTYWWSSVSVSGNGRLQFTGSAVVYVTGNVSISGNGINTSGNLPPNLLIFVSGTHSVSVSGNGNFYGGIYAPNSSVQISGNGAFYGAAMGRTVTNNGNGGAHYDKALQDAVSSGGSEVDILSWQDLS